MRPQTHVRYTVFNKMSPLCDDLTSLHCRMLNDNRGSN